MLLNPQLFPYTDRVDNAVAYSEPVAGTAIRLGRYLPNKAAFLLVIASKGGADKLNATVQTSPDGTNWVDTGMSVDDIAADDHYGLHLDEPVMEYLRFNFTESGTDCTATVTSYAFADRPLTLSSGRWPECITAPGDFVVCKESYTLDTAKAPAAATVYGTAKKIDANWECGFLTFTVASRTVGDVACVLQFTIDDGTTWLDTKITSGTLSANGTKVVRIDRPLGEKMRIKYVGGNAFDGNVTAKLYYGKRRDEKA